MTRRLHRRAFAHVIALLLLCLPAVWPMRAQEKPKAPVDPRIQAYDKGPNTIDVSKYPADIQADYLTFSKRCSKCHTLARPINATYATEDEWDRYVLKMMKKSGSVITPEDGQQIFEFLVYDSKVRKKAK